MIAVEAQGDEEEWFQTGKDGKRNELIDKVFYGTGSGS